MPSRSAERRHVRREGPEDGSGEQTPGKPLQHLGTVLLLLPSRTLQGGTHRLDKPVPSRNEMLSGPDVDEFCVPSFLPGANTQPDLRWPCNSLLCFGGFVLVAAKAPVRNDRRFAFVRAA